MHIYHNLSWSVTISLKFFNYLDPKVQGDKANKAEVIVPYNAMFGNSSNTGQTYIINNAIL